MRLLFWRKKEVRQGGAPVKSGKAALMCHIYQSGNITTTIPFTDETLCEMAEFEAWLRLDMDWPSYPRTAPLSTFKFTTDGGARTIIVVRDHIITVTAKKQ